MQVRANWLVGIVVCLMMRGAAFATDPKPSAADICDQYGPQVLKLMQAKSYLAAVRASGDYEEALLGLYPEPTFKMGLMENPAHHVSMQSAFEGWTPQSLKDLNMPDWLPAMGFDLLLAVQGPQDDDRFVVLSMDLERLAQRVGLKDDALAGKMTDQQLLVCAQLLAQNFGAIDTFDWRNEGPSRAVALKMKAPAGEVPSTIICLGNKGVLYGFLATSSKENQADNLGKLDRTIKSLDFTFKPADEKAIAAARGKIRDPADVSQSLACARELAGAGEYGAAVGELSRLRAVIGGQMPRPVVENNTARFDLYGLTLKNPDAKRWKLSQDAAGGMTTLLLEDRASVGGGGIMVGVINLTFAYGPKAGAAITDPNNEEMRKNMILSGGRGALLNMGGEIDSERFRTFQGLSGYEGVATLTKADNLKAKGMLLFDGDCLLMILEMIDARDFKDHAEEYDQVLDGALRIAPPAAPAAG